MEILRTGCGFDTATRLVEKKILHTKTIHVLLHVLILYFILYLFSVCFIFTQIICAQVFYIISKIVGILGP